jgi:hypothetical protein
LVTGGFSILGTLSGVWLSQRAAAKREAVSWAREVQREKDKWEREDQARTFEQRRTAYVEFYELVEATWTSVNQWISWGEERPDLQLRPDWDHELWDKLSAVRIYGSEAVYASALRAFELVEAWHSHSGPSRNDESLDIQAGAAKNRLLAAIRRELGVKSDSDQEAMRQALGEDYYELLQNGIPKDAIVENES